MYRTVRNIPQSLYEIYRIVRNIPHCTKYSALYEIYLIVRNLLHFTEYTALYEIYPIVRNILHYMKYTPLYEIYHIVRNILHCTKYTPSYEIYCIIRNIPHCTKYTALYSLNFEQPNNWKLQVKYTQRRDQGTYECQISTHPPKILYVRLNIVAPVVEIIDERGASVQEKFYKTGSTIELKCTISQMPQAQTFILWRHGEHMLNYDTSRGGISVKTDMSSSVIVSTLFIANASPRDSGNYTCSLGDVATGGVLVHILNGEHPAAMQHGSGTNDLCSLAYVLSLAVVTTLLNTLGITQMR
ncbi:uncharacterized protein [Palaemon carinicauda]|uniref:uncharacterized protein n=1 Tax=Palaemon carinicauda TaxID=392227 RepID=UPI0035B58452